jgi:ADP-ribose pyrophosphatase YjhB (NUDIX family)
MALAQVKLIIDVSLFSDGATALLKYTAGPDDQGGWFIPNDQLVDPEDPYDAARRLVKDQVGIDIAKAELVDIESFKGRDGSWHLAVHFRAAVAASAKLSPGEGVAEVRWFPMNALPASSAVAHHGWYLDVIAQAAQKAA